MNVVTFLKKLNITHVIINNKDKTNVKIKGISIGWKKWFIIACAFVSASIRLKMLLILMFEFIEMKAIESTGRNLVGCGRTA